MTDALRLRLLCVFAHPDDESMGMGGTLANAKRAAQGVGTYLVCASRGERGWFGRAFSWSMVEGKGLI